VPVLERCGSPRNVMSIRVRRGVGRVRVAGLREGVRVAARGAGEGESRAEVLNAPQGKAVEQGAAADRQGPRSDQPR